MEARFISRKRAGSIKIMLKVHYGAYKVTETGKKEYMPYRKTISKYPIPPNLWDKKPGQSGLIFQQDFPVMIV